MAAIIEKYAHSLKLLWKVTNRKNHNPASLIQPYDVVFDGDDMVVAEGSWPFSRLQVFNSKGRSVRTIGQGSILPFGVAVDGQGNIIATDHRERTVKVFDKSGEHLLSWKPASFEWPTGIAVDQCGRYYISDWSLGLVNIHMESGERIKKFCTRGECDSLFSCPAYLAVDSYKRIVVSDSFDRSVKIFDDSGQQLFKIANGNERENVVDPRGICVDGQSNILVADWGDSRVKLYSSDGRWIKDLLSREDGIQNPRGIAVSSSNLVVITEQKLTDTPSLKLFA